MDYNIKLDTTKELILENLTQDQIFTYYLHVPVQTHTLFCSPLRSDEHPTCSFKWINGTLYFRDWAEPKAKDCFQLVQDLHNCGFYEALRIIRADMLEGKELKIPKYDPNKVSKEKQKSTKKKIQVELCKFSVDQVNYLVEHGVTSDQVKKFKVFAPERVWLNERLVWTKYRRNDPALAYYFGKGEDGNQRWKLYFYERENYRFMGNTNRINGWIQLPDDGRFLIITKSLKDVMVFDRFNVPAIAMQNEVTIPYDYIIEELKERFDTIISFYDFDRTGVINANKLKKLYDIPYFFLTNGRFNTKDWGVKDFSDYFKNNGHQKASLLIQKLKDDFL